MLEESKQKKQVRPDELFEPNKPAAADFEPISNPLQPEDSKNQPDKEVLEGEVISSKKSTDDEFVVEPETEKQRSSLEQFIVQLRATFAEMNFNRRHVFAILGGVLGFVLLVILFVVLLRFLFSYFTGGSTDQEVLPEDEIENQENLTEATEVEIDQPEEVIEEVIQVIDVSLQSGFLLAGESLIGEEGSLFARFQQIASIEGELARRVEQLEIMREILREDLFMIVSSAEDPELAYDQRLTLLKTLFEQGGEIRNILRTDLESFREKFLQQVALKNQMEGQFFQAISDFDGAAAQANFELFVKVIQEQVVLKAEFKAREKLISLYERVLLYAQNLILNVEKNRVAIVAGVRVFDLGGDPLNLVIDEEEAVPADQVEEERLD